jgi:hypothetical protein
MRETRCGSSWWGSWSSGLRTRTPALRSPRKLGGAFHIYFNADGTLTFVGTGNSFLSLFPTDIPAGPTSTLYSGRLVFDVDPATGVFTLRDEARNKIDVCAALSG